MTDPLAEIASVIGRPGALALASLAAGRLYIPKAPPPDSWLVVLLGELMCGRLVAVYGGQELSLPRPPVRAARTAMVRELIAAGMSVRDIAVRVGLTERRVYQVLAKPAPASPLALPAAIGTSDGGR